MTLLSLFLLFLFVMHSALWLHVCEKHFIFTSWWSVPCLSYSRFLLLLLNLCVGTCCASPDPTVTGHKLVRVVCNAVWKFLKEVECQVYSAALLQSLLCVFWWNNYTNSTIPLKPQWDALDVMDWLPYSTLLLFVCAWKVVTTETLTQFRLLTHLPSTSAETGPVFSASPDWPELSESQSYQTIIRFNSNQLNNCQL